ncbi:ATP-binding protein [Streptomyces sp. NPDC060194]|uniref:ATP-binding protein n=1 Tax=Streptomyces sp. NPDC060194 TaxID=3347069 RepID=UPI0036626502
MTFTSGDQAPHRALPASAAQAREVVERLVHTFYAPLGASAGDVDVVVADALLVTSELVTNAFRHGGGLIAFDAHVSADGLLVSVTDRSSTLPVTTTTEVPAGDRTGGYGWPLVCRLASTVSITPAPPEGKCIHAFIPLT